MEVLSSAWGAEGEDGEVVLGGVESVLALGGRGLGEKARYFCSSVGERWLLVSLLTAMVELQVDNSCTATKTTFILAS